MQTTILDDRSNYSSEKITKKSKDGWYENNIIDLLILKQGSLAIVFNGEDLPTIVPLSHLNNYYTPVSVSHMEITVIHHKD